jgi:hypothetical protein
MMRLFLLSLFLLLVSCSFEENYKIEELSSPTGDNSSLPRLFTDNTGTVFMSWIETNNDTSSLYYSSLTGGKWEKPELIKKSDNWFVNWADFPSVIAKDGKAIAAHWLNKSEGGTYAYDVEITSAKNDWTDTVTPHTDNTFTEHGFVSMSPISDTTFLSVWLDGRNTGGHEGQDDQKTDLKLSKAMTLRSAILDTDLKIINEFEIDNSVCDCCGTATVRTKNGFITAYRNRTNEEIRDIYISRFVDGNWMKPIPVSNDNWKIAGCPVNGPAITSNEDLVAVAWYTGANGVENVKLSVSLDEGNSFLDEFIFTIFAFFGNQIPIINIKTVIGIYFSRM